jgi:recombinational DNA repair ATPase RecF
MNVLRLRGVVLAFLVALVAFSVAPLAWAGSYLDRAALLLDQARKEGDMLQPRTFDKEMVLVVKTLTEARARVARKMEVPAAVAKAHPHLLLVLANYERAADAASEGNFKKFMEHLNAARDEDKSFRAIITELGYALPDVGPKR